MEKINDIQAALKLLREAADQSETAYYALLQEWSLSEQGSSFPIPVPTKEMVETGRTLRNKNRENLNNAIEQLNQTLSTSDYLTQVSVEIPFLLMPVRVEARYIICRYVMRDIPVADTVDISRNNSIGARLRFVGFEKDAVGNMTYEIPSYHQHFKSASFSGRAVFNDFKPTSGNFIKRKNDSAELRLRIYPDDIFIENNENYLQPGEWLSGEQFWKNICSGKDPEEEWIQLSLAGTVSRAAWIIRCTRPVNLINIASLPSVPKFPDKKILKDGVYTNAPSSRVLPDRFIIRLYKNNQVREFSGNTIKEPLILGIDPTDDPFNKSANSGMQEENMQIKTPDYLKWIHDFDAAEKCGMAFRINLNEFPEYKDGVDKIIVTGVKFSAGAEESTQLLESLLEKHKYQEDGLKVIAKGTATNAAVKEKTVLQLKEEEAFLYFKADYKKPPVSGLITDETRLQRALGIQNNFTIPNGNLKEISESGLFNKMLWPSTWGYYILQFFTPQMDEKTRVQVRNFFSEYVSGCGSYPILKINHQPYGIIPVSSLKNWQYDSEVKSEEEKMLHALWTGFLLKLIPVWQSASNRLSNLNNISETGINDSFLNMVGLPPFTSRMKILWTAGRQFQTAMQTSRKDGTNTALFQDPAFQPANVERSMLALNINTTTLTDFSRAYQAPDHKIISKMIDNLPVIPDRLSEKINGSEFNYLEWLGSGKMLDIWNDINPAPANMKPTPTTIFNLLCRQSFLRTILESGIALTEKNPGLWLLKVKDFEALPLHTSQIPINPAALSADNHLLQTIKPITDKYKVTENIQLEPDRRTYFQSKYPFTEDISLADWVDQHKTDGKIPSLKELLEAFSFFSKSPVTKLERLFGEHFDLCSHRLDAWVTAVIQQRLTKNRIKKQRGIYLGAYGYLLQLIPETKPALVLKEQLPEYIPAIPENFSLAAIPLVHNIQAKANGITGKDKNWNNCFFYLGENNKSEIQLDSERGILKPDLQVNLTDTDGYIHAPSVTHATTAAILRSGFLNHKDDEQSARLAIGLNSKRTRQALQLLEGMQQGIPLGELLGYYCERLVHDKNLDSILFDLRKAFPIERKESSSQAVAPMTNIDGMTLLKTRRINTTSWLDPFPKIKIQKPGVDGIAVILEDYLDSLSDLLLAETVFQTTKGNTSRTSASLRALNNAGQAIQPEWIKTPMKGTGIEHRLGIIFDQQIPVAVTKWTKKGSPRSLFCPDLNNWLSGKLPAPDKIAICILLPGNRKEKISLAELDISPVDLLFIYPETFRETLNCALDLSIQLVAIKKFKLSLPIGSDQFRIDYKDRSLMDNSELSVGELASLLSALKKVILNSRSISAEDFNGSDSKAKGNNPASLLRLQSQMNKSFAPTGIFSQQLKTLSQAIITIELAIEQQKTGKALEPFIKLLLQSYLSSWQSNEIPVKTPGIFYADDISVTALISDAKVLKTGLEKRLEEGRQIMATIGTPAGIESDLPKLLTAAQLFFGKSIRIFADIMPLNKTAIKDCFEKRQLIKNTSPTQLSDWMMELAIVRKPVLQYRTILNLAELLAPTNKSTLYVALQFPFFNDREQPWIGGTLNEIKNQEETARRSLVLELEPTFTADKPFAGMIIDEWPEWIPDKTTDSGLSFQFNQPDSEPPQSMLLVVAPKETGNWNMDFLSGAVEDALELARMRLVGPGEIEANHPGLKQFLPAVLLPFAENNNQLPVAKKI